MTIYIWSATQTSSSFYCSKRSVLLVFHKEIRQNAKIIYQSEQHAKVNIW